jgi:hypothetical protein
MDSDELTPAKAKLWMRAAHGLLAIYWLTIFALTHVPRLPPPPNVPQADKIAHLLSYGLLAVLYFTARSTVRPLVQSDYWKGLLLFAAYGMADELLQIPVGAALRRARLGRRHDRGTRRDRLVSDRRFPPPQIEFVKNARAQLLSLCCLLVKFTCMHHVSANDAKKVFTRYRVGGELSFPRNPACRVGRGNRYGGGSSIAGGNFSVKQNVILRSLGL